VIKKKRDDKKLELFTNAFEGTTPSGITENSHYEA